MCSSIKCCSKLIPVGGDETSDQNCRENTLKLLGWEGSAHDRQLVIDAVTRPDSLLLRFRHHCLDFIHVSIS